MSLIITDNQKCPKHNIHYQKLVFDDSLFCEKCDFEKKKKEEAKQEKIEKEKRKQAKNQYLINTIGNEATFYKKGQFKLHPEHKEIYEYLNDGGNALFFFGDRGLGKTFLAKLIARKYLEDGFSFLVKSVVRLEVEWFSLPLDSKESYLYHLERVDLLILDEINRHSKKSENLRNIIHQVIDTRLQNKNKKTIFTSNVGIDELEKESFYETDRLRLCKQIEFRGKSYRGQS